MKRLRDQLQEHLLKRVNQCISNPRNKTCEKIEMKKESLARRNGEMVKVKATGNIKNTKKDQELAKVYYQVHFQYFIRQKENLYMEEEVEERIAEFYKGIMIEDYEHLFDEDKSLPLLLQEEDKEERVSFLYDRLQAVKYAERYWNEYNPNFKSFDVDCTNYVSQCLYAGNAPMTGYPNRSKGWWMRDSSWSYSWTVAHALRWYLPNAKSGLRAREVKDPGELQLGDVICYDFQGDGRFDHNTIVTAKDENGMPLVNAHTANSRMRYWAYEDSTAYTPNIKYKFYHIVDDKS